VWNGLNAVVEKNLHLHWMASVNRYSMLHALNCTVNKKAQLSLTNPRDAKACRCQQLLQFDVLTTLSLTILAYSFSCCCVRYLRNLKKFTENSNLWSSRSSKVNDLGVNRKPTCHFLLVINCNFSRMETIPFSRYLGLKINKLLILPPCLTPPSGGTPWDINVVYTLLKSALNGLQFRRWHYRSIFICLAVVASQIAKSGEIPTKFDLTAVQGHPRSSTMVSIESPCTTFY